VDVGGDPRVGAALLAVALAVESVIDVACQWKFTHPELSE
jgi:hypothetical protein